MTVHFTGDSHFGHWTSDERNIIKYCDRPFDCILEMDKTLILEWNRVVKPDDTVYHLGDFTLGDARDAGYYFRFLNGTIFVLRNHFHHDRRWLKRWLSKGSESYWSRQHKVMFLSSIHTMKIENKFIVLCHFPLVSWPRQHYNAWMIHSHCHNRYKPEQGLILDVGVDSAYEKLGSYRPFSLTEVRQFMESRKGL